MKPAEQNQTNDEKFNFDEWIKQNHFEDIKEILIKHNLNRKPALNITSTEFENFICDPLILTPSYSQFIPKIFCLLKNYQITNHECTIQHCYQWDNQCTNLLKSLLPSTLKKIIMDFIFSTKCINCNENIELYSYFCRKCALKRIQILNKEKIKTSKEGYEEYCYEVDQYGIWGIEWHWNVTKNYGDGEEDGIESHTIYHILSGDIVYESQGSEHLFDQDYPKCYGQTDLSFYNPLADDEDLKGYDPTLPYYQKHMVYYKEYEGEQYEYDKKGYNGKDIGICFELDLSTLDIYHQLNWHFECKDAF